MFVRYKENIYELFYWGLMDKKVISTYKLDKTDETFYKISDYYGKDYVQEDTNVYDIYEVDFYVYYMDDSETLKQAKADGKWCVNACRPPQLEKNELALILMRGSVCDEWIQHDKGTSSKIVDLYECSDYTVVYTYTYKDGQPLAEKEVVEVKMDAEAFKAEMLKYRRENI